MPRPRENGSNGPVPAARSSRLPLVFLVLALALQGTGKGGAISSPDTFWHLRTGALILETGQIPRADTFSWTASKEAWQPNAWLADCLLAGALSLGGLTAIALFRALSVLVIGLLCYLVVRRWGGLSWPAAIASALVLLLMNPFIIERPHLFGFVLFPLLLFMASEALDGSNPKLLGLGALSMLWVNLHGSFTVGLVVVVAMALGRGLQTRRVQRPLLLVLVVGLGTLINPYGPAAVTHALNIPQLSSFIEEWQGLSIFDPRGILYLVYGAGVIWAVIRTGRWRRIDRIFPLVLLALLTLRVIRGAPFLLLLGAPEIALALGTLVSPSVRAWIQPRRGPVILGLGVAWLVLMVRAAPTLRALGRLSAVFPAAATAAIPRGCRLLNEYEHGGYIIQRRWPEVLVSQDGRNDLYGPRRIQQQIRILSSSSPASLDDMGVRCVLLRPRRPLVKTLDRDRRWKRSAGDRGGILFVRTEDRGS
jgi:hypothetical protein